jgi:hypothetical protein
MTYAIVSIHTPNFKELSDVTWPNKVEYANRHSYKSQAKTDGFLLEHASGEKIPFIREYLKANPDVEWVWWLDTDTLITNYTKKIEEFLDNDYHFIITTDNNGINAGSFFVRNSPESLAYLDYMLEQYPTFKEQHGFFAEQECMVATYKMPEWQPLIKIIPQKLINAYDVWPNTWIDFSTFASWEPGDFVVHWPGSTMETRLTRHIPFYRDKIIK